MTNEEILIKVKEYFENELKTLNYGLRSCDWMKKDPQRFIHQAMSACVAIVMFSQDLGVEYEPLAELYEPYDIAFRELLKKARDLAEWKR